MALVLYQDFQSFSVGDPGPYGALTASPGAIGVAISNTAQADGTQGPYGKSKYLAGQSGAVYFNDLTYRSALTILVANRSNSLPNLGNILELCNKAGAGAGGFEYFAVAVAPDSTMVPLFAGNPIGAPGDFVFSSGNWNFIQFNVAFTQPGGVGTPVHIAWDVMVDGKLDISGTYVTVPLVVGAGFINVIGIGGFAPALQSCNFGEISIYDTLQALPFFPHPGTSLARSTNEVIELLIVPGTIPPNPPVPSCPLSAASVGVFYSQQIPVSGGTPPLTFTLQSGAFPPGLSMSPTGLISGTPTAPAGSYSWTVRVTDSLGLFGDITCGITTTGGGPPPPPPPPPPTCQITPAPSPQSTLVAYTEPPELEGS